MSAMENTRIFSILDDMKHHHREIVFFLILLCVNPLVAQQQSDAEIKLRLAQNYERSGDWENAVKLYESLCAKDSLNVVFFESLRRGYLQLKRYNDARRIIGTQLRVRPNDVALLAQLGIVDARAGDEAAALSTWNRALAIDRRNINSYFTVATAAAECRLFERATELYLRGRSELGDPMLFVNEVANLYSLMMNFAGATDEFVKLIMQNPLQLSFVQSRMATYTYRADARHEAIKVVEVAAHDNSSNVALHQLLAWLLMEGKQFDKAYEIYLSIDERTKANGREVYSFAERALKEKKYTLAAKAFKTIITQYPRLDRMAAAKLGYAVSLEKSLSDTDTVASAVTSGNFLDQTLILQNTTEQPSEIQTEYAQILGAYEELVRDYAKTEFAAQALLHIARIKFELLFDVDAAIVTCQKIVKEYSAFLRHSASATLLMGDAYLAKADIDNAAKSYRSLDNLEATFPELKETAWFRLAETEFFKGNIQDAIKQLQELSKNPQSDVTNDALSLLMFLQEHSTVSAAPLKDFAKAYFLIQQRNFPDAVGILQNLLKQYPTSSLADESLILLGNLFVSMKRYTEGIASYERLLNEFPESILFDRAQMNIGTVYQWNVNDKVKAVAAYQTLLEKFPNSVFTNEARKRIRELRGESL